MSTTFVATQPETLALQTVDGQSFEATVLRNANGDLTVLTKMGFGFILARESALEVSKRLVAILES